MRRARLALLVAVALLAALATIPTGALAADAVTVTGAVLRDGQPQPGVRVTVSVAQSDILVAGTTDESGAFSIEVEATIGSVVRVDAWGQESRSEPDEHGCVHTEMPAGHAEAILDAIPPTPLEVSLDELVTGTVCTATVTPRITPPATDARVAPRPASGSGGGLLLALGALALAGSGPLILARRRR